MPLSRTAFFALGLLISPLALKANAAGFQYDENFTVLAADQTLAAEVLASANQYRRQVAQEWLRGELPPGVGETVIHLTLSRSRDRGLTWAIDSPNRSLHKIWLTTDRNRALGGTLHHEIAHIVLATRYPQQLPAWAEEGVCIGPRGSISIFSCTISVHLHYATTAPNPIDIACFHSNRTYITFWQ